MSIRDILRGGARRIEVHSDTCSRALTAAFLIDLILGCSVLECENGGSESLVESPEESTSEVIESDQGDIT